MSIRNRTRAPAGGVVDDELSLVSGASLDSAVANSETEVGLAAVAGVGTNETSRVASLVDHTIEANVLHRLNTLEFRKSPGFPQIRRKK